METQGSAPKSTVAGWIFFAIIIMMIGGIVVWVWTGRNEHDAYDSSGLNLAEAPKQDVVPNVSVKPGAPPVDLRPIMPTSKPIGPSTFPLRMVQRPEWAKAADSFVRLARQSKYRNSTVLRAWAQDFMAYPDLNTLGRKYARDRDLLFFTVSVLRSTNFAKMLRKYGPSPDIKNFFMDFMASPGVPESSRALFDDKNVMYSIKDLTIPGLPPLGQLMATGAQSQSQAPQANDPALRKFMQDQQRQAGIGTQ